MNAFPGWRAGLLPAALALAVAGCNGTGAPTLDMPVRAANEAANGAAVNGAPLPEMPAIPSRPREGGRPPMPQQQQRAEVPGVRVTEVARGLEIPWGLGFAPDGRVFVTERPGRIRVLREGGAPAPYLDLGEVVHRGEGGLMGLALHPEFPRQAFLYVMYTTRNGGRVVNRVSRFRDEGETAGSEEVLIDNIPAAQFHNGGIVKFGPDGMLYVGTGDASQPRLSQDARSLAGKVLRATPEGRVPPDNPFRDSLVYAYGFRNVVGLAWNPATGDLWAASHGPSGEFPGMHHRDAVYVVRPGGNHGWPLVVGTSDREEIVSPVLYYPERAVPPGGALFYDGELLPQLRGSFFMTSLGATHLQRVRVEGRGNVTAIERWWPGRHGRLRAVEQGPDGAIWFTTSNRDGRAERSYPGSDFIYRIVPSDAPGAE
jgi:aldose sugar dehydrogenase